MEKVSYKYSSTQLNIPKEIASAISSYGKEKIKDSQINQDEGGREDEFHITLLYGIKDESSKNYIIDDIIKKKFNGSPIKIKLGVISKFYQDEYDVLKIGIDDYTGKLEAIFNELKNNVENDNKYPDYHPHCTIAYINKGECEDLVGDETFKGQEVILKEFKYSPKDEGVENPQKPEFIKLSQIKAIEDKLAAANLIEPRAFDPKFLREVFPQIKSVSATEDEKFLRKYLEEWYFMQPATADVVLHQYNKLLGEGKLDNFIAGEIQNKDWERSNTSPNILVKKDQPVVPIVPVPTFNDEFKVEPKKVDSKPVVQEKDEEVKYNTHPIEASKLETGDVILEEGGVLSAFLRKKRNRIVVQELMTGKTHPILINDKTKFEILTVEQLKQIIQEFAKEGYFSRLPDSIKSDYSYLKHRVAALKNMMLKRSIAFLTYQELAELKDKLKEILQGKIIGNLYEIDNIYDYPSLISWLQTHGKKNKDEYRLNLKDATEIKSAVREINDLVYHTYKYKIDNNSLVFLDKEEMSEVKQLLKNKNYFPMDSIKKESKADFCECENNGCGHDLPCGKPPTINIETNEGSIWSVCRECYDKWPVEYKKSSSPIIKQSISIVNGEAVVYKSVDGEDLYSNKNIQQILASGDDELTKFTAIKNEINDILQKDVEDIQIKSVEFDYINPIIDDQDIWNLMALYSEDKEVMAKLSGSFDQPREFKERDLVILVNKDKALRDWGSNGKEGEKPIDRIVIRPKAEYLNQGAKIKNQLLKDGFNVQWEEADIAIYPKNPEDIENISNKIKELPVEVIYPFDLTQGKPPLSFMQLYYVWDTKVNQNGEQEIYIDDDTGEENWFLSSGFVLKPGKMMSNNKMELKKGSKINIYKDPINQKNFEGIGVLSHFITKDKDIQYWKVDLNGKKEIKAILVKESLTTRDIVNVLRNLPVNIPSNRNKLMASWESALENSHSIEGTLKVLKVVKTWLDKTYEGPPLKEKHQIEDWIKEFEEMLSGPKNPTDIQNNAYPDIDESMFYEGDNSSGDWDVKPKHSKYLTYDDLKKFDPYDLTGERREVKVDKALLSSLPLEDSDSTFEGIDEGPGGLKPALGESTLTDEGNVYTQIDPNQSPSTIAKQLSAEVQKCWPNSLTYTSIWDTAGSTGLYPTLDNYTLVGILNLVAINFGLQRISWDSYFYQNADTTEEVFKNFLSPGNDSGLANQENQKTFSDFVDENFDNAGPDKIFIVDRLIDEKVKHFMNLPQLLEESADVVHSSIKRVKKDSSVLKLKLNNINVDSNNLGGKIVSGKFIFDITLRSKMRNGKLPQTKVISVVLPIQEQKVQNPKNFTYANISHPLQTYYINSIFDDNLDTI